MLKISKLHKMGNALQKVFTAVIVLSSLNIFNFWNRLFPCKLQSLDTHGFLFSAHPKLEYDSRLKGVQLVEAGSTITLNVSVSGIPTPNITWLLEDEPVEKSPRISIETKEDFSTLTVKNAMLDYSGTYTIDAENVVGKAVADFETNVKGTYLTK